MTIALYGPTASPSGAWTRNVSTTSAVLGTNSWSVTSTATTGYIAYAVAATTITVHGLYRAVLKVLGSAVPSIYAVSMSFYDAGNAFISETVGTPLEVTATSVYIDVEAAAPPTAASVRMLLRLVDTPALAGRTITIEGATIRLAAYPAEAIAAALERDLQRDAFPDSAGTYQISSGAPAKLAGILTFLCDTWTDLRALDALYQQADTVTPVSSDALNGLAHVAVRSPRYTAERAQPGKPSKWLAAVDVREV